jgi:hypothetical protein
MRTWFPLFLAMALASGCNDSTSPRDRTPPAAPRGVRSVTGDHTAYLTWLANTESDVAGYRVYISDCAGGPSCPYDPVGQTDGTTFAVGSLANGETRYFAVAAYDRAGNESALSYDTVFDTPRPEGFDLALTSFQADPDHAGFDFSAHAVLPFDATGADVYFGSSGGAHVMYAPYTDTDIQDAGYTTHLDDVDFAPDGGWSPTGAVELITGHAYVVRIGQNVAKFRVSSVSSARVIVDWAYQIDPNNPELFGPNPDGESGRVKRQAAWPG